MLLATQACVAGYVLDNSGSKLCTLCLYRGGTHYHSALNVIKPRIKA